jgi:GAF domain-containing protein/HAMP domain-containing protein
MNNTPFPQFFEVPPDRVDLPAEQRRLYRTLLAALHYFPVLLGFNALGFTVIYVLGLTGLLDKNDPRILAVAGISLLASLSHIPLFSLLRRGQLNSLTVFILLINSLSGAAQIFLWQGIIWFPLLLAIAPATLFINQNGLQPRYRWLSFIYSLLMAALIVFLDRILPYDRMVVIESLSQTAAFAIYLLITAAIFVLVLFNSVINFHTITGRLVTTFTFVVILSAMAILIIGALASLFYDRQSVFQELSAISAMKTSQVESTLSNLEQDANLTLTDRLNDQRVNFLLSHQPGTLLYDVNTQLVRAYLVRQKGQNSRYEEFILLDANGKALISTNPANVARDFSAYGFFQNALAGINSALEYDFPGGSEKTSVLLVKPITVNGSLGGAMAARVSFEPVMQIMAAKTGVGQTSETYLASSVGGKVIPITTTRQNATEINSLATQETIIRRNNSGSGIYANYAGTSVLGSYARIPVIGATLITEVEQQEITSKTLRILATNIVFGIFTALLAFSIVLITSRSISLPLVKLSEKATLLASGELSTRMVVDRQDEIGALASSFNAMASELQTLVKTLEQKVEDRTQDLQKQASYLRLAAEVARDSANTNNLDELLNRAAQLILDRFGFYHTGIFLLDERGEYAILQASPTEAGREMISRNHKLRVGQEGIVGNVSATGEPRIALDTGLDVTYFNNPMLPMTRSEMALPLKVNEQLLGVLDVQSEQPEAFTQDDISTLQIMADQLALAIQRVRLAQEQEYNLRQLESAYQQFTLTSWRKFSHERGFQPGYRFDGVKLTALETYPEGSQETLRKGKSVILLDDKETKNATLAVPLKLRDQILGVLNIGFGESTINPETINLAEEVASRLAVALENARLYSETQKQAEQTRAISEISNIITSSVNIENILRTAVQELGHINPDTEVTVRLHDGREKE